jgi:hypothetical protein
LTDLDVSVLPIKTKIVSCHTAYSKPVKQEVNGTVILPPLVFSGFTNTHPGPDNKVRFFLTSKYQTRLKSSGKGKQVSISPTFYEQLLRQNPFAKKLKTQIVST